MYKFIDNIHIFFGGLIFWHVHEILTWSWRIIGFQAADAEATNQWTGSWTEVPFRSFSDMMEISDYLGLRCRLAHYVYKLNRKIVSHTIVFFKIPIIELWFDFLIPTTIKSGFASVHPQIFRRSDHEEYVSDYYRRCRQRWAVGCWCWWRSDPCTPTESGHDSAWMSIWIG